MKRIYSVICMVLGLCCSLASTIQAQNNNMLRIPDVTATLGKSSVLPVYLDNTSEIIGIQFTLIVPEGMTLNTEEIALETRGEDHMVSIKEIENNKYLCMVYSPMNKPLRGYTGKLFDIEFSILDVFVDGSTYPMKLTDVVLGNADATNILTSSSIGNLLIANGPDLMTQNVVVVEKDLAPNSIVNVSWLVVNDSELPTTGGWKEQVYLVKEGGMRSLIGTVYNDVILAGKGQTARSASLKLPQTIGLDGTAKVQVKVIANADSGESTSAAANNITTSAATVNVHKMLFLEVPQVGIDENNNSLVKCKLSRSGSWSSAETFTLSKTGDDRIELPVSLTIPKGQSATYFYIKMVDNDVLNNDSVVTISASGNGYEEVKAQLIVVDNEYPDLTITTPKYEITEGEDFQLHIEVGRVSSKPVTLYLTCDRTEHFKYPAQVTLPAGTESITVDVTAIEDNLPNVTLDAAFAVKASHYNSSECYIELLDNDLPEIELTLTPNTISESAGPTAVMATLKRLTHNDNKVTVKLTDNSNGRLYYSIKDITLEAGDTEAEFTIGVTDNSLVDGEHTYQVAAAVYISSCSCSAYGTEMGVVSHSLTLLDDDGPALKVETSQSMMLEGAEESTVLTITRNTDTSKDLTVTITSDYDEGLIYEHTVMIPAGSTSVKIPVSVKANETSSDDRTVVFSVEATGYTKGTCWIMVTDQTLPDMTIKSIDIKSPNILAGDKYGIDITFANIGIKEIPARSTYTVYIDGEALTLTIAESILPMEEKMVSLDFTAPSVPGNYNIGVECNKERNFEEILEFNNTFSIPFVVNPAYTYAIETDRINYRIGDVVKISGKITAFKGSNSGIDVEPYIVCYGSRQALLATTDVNGNFTAEYTLPVGMAGDFIVGACAPGANAKDGSAKIHVYGMTRTSASYIKNYLIVGTPHVIGVPIKNLSSLPLHNIKATVTNNRGNCQVTAKDIVLLEGNSEAMVELTLLSDKPSTTSAWERVEISLSSDEGAAMNFVLYNYVYTQQAELVVDKSFIRTNIKNSGPTNIPIILTNNGLGQTGRITITVPDDQNFFSLTTPAEIPSLHTGDSTIIGLCFNPAGFDVNVIQKGSIAINCENADGLAIPYSLKIVSEKNGNLLVRVQDENTIYGNAEGQHPYVDDACVILKDYNTGKVLYTDSTTVEGTVLFEQIPEGYYTLFVSASKHSSYMQNVLVSPGETTEHLATISYQAISIRWNVEEASVEDIYEIVSEFVYETQVPVPVVELITPDTLNLYDVELGGQLLYYVTVVNRGLITANNVCVELPVREGISFTPLDAYAGFDLAPQESRSIPVLVTLDTNTANAMNASDRTRGSSKGKCHSETFANWEWVCKSDRTAWIGKVGYFLMRACDPDVSEEDGPKEQKPANEEITRPKYPDTPEAREPQLRYVKRPASHIDLMAINEIISTVSCSMACLLPTELPSWMLSLLDAPDQDERFKCVIDELLNHGDRFSKARALRMSQNLRNYYLDRLQLLIDYDSITYSYYKELTNAPQMMANEETFGLLVYNLDAVLDDMTQMHDDGTLYSTDISSIYDIYIQLMPHRNADWYDFNLLSYIERQFNTFRLYDNMNIEGSNYCDINLLEKYRNEIAQFDQKIKEWGYVDRLDMIQSMNEDAGVINANSDNVCATVKLQFKQEMVFTRQAFRGTLVIENSTNNKLTDISPFISATNEDGILVTNHEMQISLESVEGFVEISDGMYSLDENQIGTFTFLFIPTKFAAPTHDVTYKFGGSLAFNDGDGLKRHTLYPVALLVKPSPNLEMTYFMQRDIFGDDPLTTDVVEPMEPAEFSLLINNVGYGDATNVHMVTEQPKIIENEKGLFIDFELLSSQLNGGEKTLAMGGSVPTEFGTIPAQSTAYAQWWIQSTLLGHFTEYDIKATHVTSYGNEDLSLLDTVTIHELIRSIKVPAEEDKVLTGFLVNDIADAEDMPDMLYLSDGVIESVNVTTEATISKNSDTEYLLTVTPLQAGWNYGSLVDPTYGKQDIVRIVRQSDGAEINLRNIWQTDRTLRDGKDPLYESRIHFVDKFGATEESYQLTFEPKPDKVLEVESFVGVPASDVVVKDALKEVTVCFNKPIDAATFTTRDLTLNCQGKAQDVSQIVITQVSNTEYKLDISALSAFNGYYVLTVQTAGIVDNEGFAGESGKTASWVQYVGGKVNLMIQVTPDNAGTVTPAAGLYDYEETVALVATTNEGYEFLSWSSNDEVIATTPTHEYLMEGDVVITATFTPKNYNVEIVCDVNEGVVTGAGTGVYPYGNALTLTAEPLNGYIFDGWYIADSKVAESSTFVHTVDSAVQIEARFTQVIYDLTLRLENGWNWISAYFADEELMTSWKFLAPIKSGIERVVGMEKEIVNDPEYGLTGNLLTLSPAEGYKIKTNRLMLNTWTGAKVNTDSTQIALKKGWNWIGYPAAIDMEVNEAFANAELDNEDYIVGQDGFAQYADGEWIGTLTSLAPGKGYMYHSKSDKEFTYNTAIYAKAPSVYRSSVVEATPWSVNKYKYPNIMCMIAELFADDTIIDMENCILGAFCGDECRGVGSYVNGEVMISIYGEKNEDITFKVMDNDFERTFDVLENVPFTETLFGTVKQPYPLHINDGTGVLNVQDNWRVQVENGNLYLSLNNKMFDHVTLTDVYGNTVLAIENVASGEPINVSTFIDGVYIVSVEQDGIMYYKKIMIVGKQ